MTNKYYIDNSLQICKWKDNLQTYKFVNGIKKIQEVLLSVYQQNQVYS